MGQSLSKLMPAMDIPWDLGGGLNVPTLGFTVAIVMIATLASGTAPALLSARADLTETLNEGGRAGGAGTKSHRLRGLLVTGEVAMALVALIGAGLFFRSFHNASSVQPGFDMTNLSMSRFYLSNAGYSAHEQHLFCRKLRERMEAQPGVLGVTYSDVIPLANPGKGMPYHQLEVDGYIPRRDEQMILQRATVPPGYFRLMDIPLLKGRDFTGMDGENKPLVIVVNETFARRFFGGRDPIGRKVRVEHQPATVIGLVKDSKYGALIETQLPFFYIPFDQWFAPGLNFAVMLKTSGDPILLTPVLQREALALNPDAVFHTSRMEDATEASLYPQRVAATLLSVVGVVCLVLAAIGLYCVMSYAVSQRTQELGVRLALGASRSDVLVLVVREGLRLTVPGLVAGIAAALGAARLVSGMLFQVSAADPATFAAAAMFLALVAGIASYLPAVRATRLDPMRAIRCQ
jgi:predicted permease